MSSSGTKTLRRGFRRGEVKQVTLIDRPSAVAKNASSPAKEGCLRNQHLTNGPKPAVTHPLPCGDPHNGPTRTELDNSNIPQLAPSSLPIVSGAEHHQSRASNDHQSSHRPANLEGHANSQSASESDSSRTSGLASTNHQSDSTLCAPSDGVKLPIDAVSVAGDGMVGDVSQPSLARLTRSAAYRSTPASGYQSPRNVSDSSRSSSVQIITESTEKSSPESPDWGSRRSTTHPEVAEDAIGSLDHSGHDINRSRVSQTHRGRGKRIHDTRGGPINGLNAQGKTISATHRRYGPPIKSESLKTVADLPDGNSSQQKGLCQDEQNFPPLPRPATNRSAIETPHEARETAFSMVVPTVQRRTNDVEQRPKTPPHLRLRPSQVRPNETTSKAIAAKIDCRGDLSNATEGDRGISGKAYKIKQSLAEAQRQPQHTNSVSSELTKNDSSSPCTSAHRAADQAESGKTYNLQDKSKHRDKPDRKSYLPPPLREGPHYSNNVPGEKAPSSQVRSQVLTTSDTKAVPPHLRMPPRRRYSRKNTIGGMRVERPDTHAAECQHPQRFGEDVGASTSEVNTDVKLSSMAPMREPEDSSTPPTSGKATAQSTALRPDVETRESAAQTTVNVKPGGESDLSTQNLQGQGKRTQPKPTQSHWASVPLQKEKPIGQIMYMNEDEASCHNMPLYESQLVEWDGTLKPPPVGDEWSSRDPYDPSGVEKKDVVVAWTDWQGQIECDPASIDVTSPDFITGAATVGEDNNLEPVVDESIHDTLPSKQSENNPGRYLTAQDKMLTPQNGVTTTPNDTDSQATAKPKPKRTKAEKQAERASILKMLNTPPPLSEFAPAACIYMRPADLKDARQIMDIYNYWIQKSVFAPEKRVTDEAYWQGQIRRAADTISPFIVAVDIGVRCLQASDIVRKKHESIVGFAFSANFGGNDDAFRCTVKLEVWVHSLHLRQGIGRCLLDRMLFASDILYSPESGAPFCNDGDMMNWGCGGRRSLKTITFSMLYSKASQAEMEWKRAWLKKYRFVDGGCIPQIGWKHDQSLHLQQMYYTTARRFPA